MSQNNEEYVIYRLKKALETFEVAELLYKNSKWNSAVNRLYYSAFYAVSALLAKNELITKSHSGTKTQFFLNFIKTGEISIEFGKLYSDLFDLRQKGDYGDFFDFKKEDVKTLLLPTKNLILQIKKLI